jgi:hypothetical protein
MYPEQLRPKILEGRYRAPDADWWKNEELTNLMAYGEEKLRQLS